MNNPKTRLWSFFTIVLLGGIGKLFAVLREASSAYFLGISDEFGAFLVALFVVSIIIIILNEMLTPYITTNYVDILRKGDLVAASYFAGHTVLLVFLLVMLLSLVIYFIAPLVVTIIVVGFSDKLKEETVLIIRLLLPYFCFSGVVNFLGVLQQCHNKYILPALNNQCLLSRH